MLYDFHTHALHPKIANKVLSHLQGHYDIAPQGTGLIQDLLARIRRAGLDRAVVLCAATAPAQVIPANNWVLELQKNNPEVVPFGTLHPDYPDWEKELDRLRAARVKGLKFHPEFQGFWLDDPKLYPIIEEAARDFVFLIHIGDRPEPDKNPSCPFKLAKLVRDFPQARFIAPHMGGYLHWKWALESIIGKNLFIDTSSTLSFIDDQTLNAIIRAHPREKILFGSDYPLFDPEIERNELKKRLKLSENAMDEILSNAEGLLA